jgi:hypothetical protein
MLVPSMKRFPSKHGGFQTWRMLQPSTEETETPLNEFIKGPVWIFEKEYIGDNEYFLSINVEQFADL